MFDIMCLGDEMSKLYKIPIEVKINSDGQPITLRWNGLWHLVISLAIIEEPQSSLEWWQKPILPQSPRYRCETKRGMVCDLVRGKDDGWVLERVWD